MLAVILYFAGVCVSAALVPSLPVISAILFGLLGLVPWTMSSIGVLARSIVFLHYYCSSLWKFMEYWQGRLGRISRLDGVVHVVTYSGLLRVSNRLRPLTVDVQSCSRFLLFASLSFTLNWVVATIAPYSHILAAFILSWTNMFGFISLSYMSMALFSLLGYPLEPFNNSYWKAESVGEFWRLWNIHFQRTLHRNVFRPIAAMVPKTVAAIAVFLVSAAAHWIPVYAFAGGSIYDVLAWNLFFIAQFAVIGIEQWIASRRKAFSSPRAPSITPSTIVPQSPPDVSMSSCEGEEPHGAPAVAAALRVRESVSKMNVTPSTNLSQAAANVVETDKRTKKIASRVWVVMWVMASAWAIHIPLVNAFGYL